MLDKIDYADLVIFDLNPKIGDNQSSPNVFYELAIIHALGIPYIIVASQGTTIPFYAGGSTRSHFVDHWVENDLKNVLRAPLLHFLDDTSDSADLSLNPISNYYNNIPLIDISAVMGLATGYYYNFLRRLILDDGLITRYPKKIRHVIVVQPSSLQSTYNGDFEQLEKN